MAQVSLPSHSNSPRSSENQPLPPCLQELTTKIEEIRSAIDNGYLIRNDLTVVSKFSCTWLAQCFWYIIDFFRGEDGFAAYRANNVATAIFAKIREVNDKLTQENAVNAEFKDLVNNARDAIFSTLKEKTAEKYQETFEELDRNLLAFCSQGIQRKVSFDTQDHIKEFDPNEPIQNKEDTSEPGQPEDIDSKPELKRTSTADEEELDAAIKDFEESNNDNQSNKVESEDDPSDPDDHMPLPDAQQSNENGGEVSEPGQPEDLDPTLNLDRAPTADEEELDGAMKDSEELKNDNNGVDSDDDLPNPDEHMPLPDAQPGLVRDPFAEEFVESDKQSHRSDEQKQILDFAPSLLSRRSSTDSTASVQSDDEERKLGRSDSMASTQTATTYESTLYESTLPDPLCEFRDTAESIQKLIEEKKLHYIDAYTFKPSESNERPYDRYIKELAGKHLYLVRDPYYRYYLINKKSNSDDPQETLAVQLDNGDLYRLCGKHIEGKDPLQIFTLKDNLSDKIRKYEERAFTQYPHFFAYLDLHPKMKVSLVKDDNGRYFLVDTNNKAIEIPNEVEFVEGQSSWSLFFLTTFPLSSSHRTRLCCEIISGKKYAYTSISENDKHMIQHFQEKKPGQSTYFLDNTIFSSIMFEDGKKEDYLFYPLYPSLAESLELLSMNRRNILSKQILQIFQTIHAEIMDSKGLRVIDFDLSKILLTKDQQPVFIGYQSLTSFPTSLKFPSPEIAKKMALDISTDVEFEQAAEKFYVEDGEKHDIWCAGMALVNLYSNGGLTTDSWVGYNQDLRDFVSDSEWKEGALDQFQKNLDAALSAERKKLVSSDETKEKKKKQALKTWDKVIVPMLQVDPNKRLSITDALTVLNEAEDSKIEEEKKE